jgi:hypothetical protein
MKEVKQGVHMESIYIPVWSKLIYTFIFFIKQSTLGMSKLRRNVTVMGHFVLHSIEFSLSFPLNTG